uniref:STARD3 N-terminal-like protein isoform X3 n=1 Tax=Geotrypetes seraphini TaxID=260995 RepID=A0A6P8PQE5_GEOSA|nr:STARD3 N-terminal-like protein isoform X3 [Geotrypetes seraphini]
MHQAAGDSGIVRSSSLGSSMSIHGAYSVSQAELMARIESYEGREKKDISDVRRTFCLFVTFDLLFVTLLWIIELNVNGGIGTTLIKEVVNYDYLYSFFDIFIFYQGAFGYVLPIISFILPWIETWFLDFKVLPQEAEEENRLLMVQDVSEQAALIQPRPLSDGQFYSPPESVAGSDEEIEEKEDSEKSVE